MPDSIRDEQLLVAQHRCEEAAAAVRRAVRFLADVKDVAGLKDAETQVPGCIEELDRLIERIAGAATPKGKRAGVDERGVEAATVPDDYELRVERGED